MNMQRRRASCRCHQIAAGIASGGCFLLPAGSSEALPGSFAVLPADRCRVSSKQRAAVPEIAAGIIGIAAGRI